MDFARYIIISFFVTAAILFSQAPSRAESLEIVTESWAPYVFKEDGRFAGFDYEVVVAVLAEMGHEVHLTFYPWKRCLSMVENGEADALLDVGWTEEREKVMAFPAEPLSSSRTVVFHLKAKPFTYNSLADLKGMSVGTQHGYTHSDEFHADQGFIKEPVESVETNIKKLLYGRIDLFVANQNYGLFAARKMGVLDQIGHAEKAISGGDVYLAFSRKSPHHDLAQEFGKALQRFKTTNRYRAILSMYGQE